MVLENASSEDGYNEKVPQSDGDPYDNYGSSQAPQRSIDGAGSIGTFEMAIDTTGFPRPFPIIGPLTGYTDAFYTKVVRMRVQDAMQSLQRPPTQDETTAIAYWTAKQLSITSYGNPIGMLGGAYRAYATKDRFRFPLYQPNLDSFPKETFPSPKMAFLKGARATMAWHFARLAAYACAGAFVSSILFASYGMSVTAVGEIQDSRLKDYVQAMRKRAQEMKGKLPQQPGQHAPTEVHEQKDASPWNDIRDERGVDASPVSGYAGEDNPGRQSQTQSPTPYASTPKPKSSWSTKPAENHPEQETKSSVAFFDDGDDDASPTRREPVVEKTSHQGSAWDRVRAQSSTSSTGGNPSGWSRARSRGRQQQQSPEPASEDSYSFSKSDEERQLAKNEAQREFDARVERERQGGDFSTGGNQNRW